MKLIEIFTYSLGVSLIVFIISMFIAIVPCEKVPATPNPQGNWDVCSLNPDTCNNMLSKDLNIGVTKKYLGMTGSLRNASIILLIFAFAICFSALYLVNKSRHRN